MIGGKWRGSVVGWRYGKKDYRSQQPGDYAMTVMLGFAVLMIVSNIALLRHESFRVQNILGLGSKTKWWFWPNAFVRECIGLLANRALPELIWLIILVVLFGGIATQVIW